MERGLAVGGDIVRLEQAKIGRGVFQVAVDIAFGVGQSGRRFGQRLQMIGAEENVVCGVDGVVEVEIAAAIRQPAISGYSTITGEVTSMPSTSVLSVIDTSSR